MEEAYKWPDAAGIRRVLDYCKGLSEKVNISPYKFGIVGGTFFALIYTFLHYIIENEFTLLGLVGGFSWFLTTIALSYINKE